MAKIGPLRKNDQKVSGMVKDKSTPSNIFGYSKPSSSSRQTRTAAKAKDTSAFTDTRKVSGSKVGIAKPSSSISGAKIESSPITTRKTAGKNTGRLAQKASKLRSKGEAALESGNLGKAKRLRRRYDRQTARMNKSMSNASSGYSMKPGSKQKDTPGPINSVQQGVINDLNKNFNIKNDI